MSTIVDDIIELCRAAGLEVIEKNEFAPADPVMVYGPLDSIAILLELAMRREGE